MSTPKICPVLASGPLEINTNCKEERCAWWTGCECAMLCVAETLGDMETTGIIVHEEAD